jgi:hypothetical protein
MNEKVRFFVLLGLLLASIALLWFANTAANNVVLR